MINLPKLSYHFALYVLSILLIQCGGKKTRVKTIFSSSNDGFTCDGGRGLPCDILMMDIVIVKMDPIKRSLEDIVEEPSFTPNAYCTGGNVNVRSTPEIIDNVVGSLDKNQAVVVLDDINGNDPNVGVE